MAVDGAATLVPGMYSAATLTTDEASKDCHATFTAVSSYTGADATVPTLPAPMLIASGHAIGVLGEQPGIVGIFDTWTQAIEPGSGLVSWRASISAAAKNIPATAVQYGIIINLATPETRPVHVDLSIEYYEPSS